LATRAISTPSTRLAPVVLSTAPGTPTLDDYVDWLAEAIDALATDGFHLHGHHTGMHLALALALRWPERVRSLALNGVLGSAGVADQNSVRRGSPPSCTTLSCLCHATRARIANP
jgi:pimeloyl-ACP methyl ester carboxylesterase